MEYQIFCDGNLIAEFKYAIDRNDCLKMLQKMNTDATFTTVEDPSTTVEEP